MGRVINNPITSSFSGRFGDDLVFRQIGNRTFFSRRTVAANEPTPAQQAHRQLFTEAQMFASQVLADPQQSEFYCVMAKVNDLKTSQLAAIKDFISKPEIERVDSKHYTGNVSELIYIKPKMMLKIRQIDVSIFDASDMLLESGQAVKHELGWKYKTTVFNAHPDGSRIVLVAHDRMGKTSRMVHHIY